MNISSDSKPTLSMSSGKRTKRESLIGDRRVYSYDEIIESQEKLNDSNEFQFYLDDVRVLTSWNMYRNECFYIIFVF